MLGGSRLDVIVREGSRAIDRIAYAACPNFVRLYILVVNKSLSNEVPYTGRCWQRNATKKNKHDSADEQGVDERKASPHLLTYYMTLKAQGALVHDRWASLRQDAGTVPVNLWRRVIVMRDHSAATQRRSWLATQCRRRRQFRIQNTATDCHGK